MSKKIAPSILSADFAKLAEEIQAVEKAGADLLHLDVMDGHFVPNLTIGPMIVEAVKRSTDLTLDTHLMIDNPDDFIDAFADAGTHMLSVHQEVCPNIRETLAKIKGRGMQAGVAINPDTGVDSLYGVLDHLDYILVMSVFPGFGGQKFIPEVLSKIETLVKLREQRQLKFQIEVDGGINLETISSVAEAGADIFVAGSAVFKNPPYEKIISELRSRLG